MAKNAHPKRPAPGERPAQRLFAIAKERGLDDKALAYFSGLSSPGIKLWESGTTNEPDLGPLLKVAAALGLQIDDLWPVAFGAQAEAERRELDRKLGRPNLERKRLGVSDVLEGDGAELHSQRLRAELMGEIREALEQNRKFSEKLAGRVAALELRSGQGGGGKRTRR